MSQAQRLAEAVRRVCAGPLSDFAKGLIDRDKLNLLIERRRPEILAVLRDAPEPPERCSVAGCRNEATTVINAARYCDPHAATAPRVDGRLALLEKRK